MNANSGTWTTMKFTATILLATAGWTSALTQQCSTSQGVNEGGNWFCGAVNQILYEGIRGSGSFKAVTAMGANGECLTEDKPYTGSLAPLDEDLSIHVRGPFELKEFAVYNLGSEKSKRDSPGLTHIHARRHGHYHLHKMHKHKRQEWITATINGDVVSWANPAYVAPPTVVPSPPPPPPAPAPAPVPVPPAAAPLKLENVLVSPISNAALTAVLPPSSGGSWNRVAYYSAEQQVADNIVFLGNYGGQGSGAWDTTWGNSLSYLNTEGTGGSDSPKVLGNVYIPSNKEFSIFSAEKCDGSCGFSRAPDVAYKGFAGNNKMFLFKFRMPLDGTTGFNADMPALWALNGRIPRTQQYGSCSCWTTGCGEFDIFEVLATGDTKCKSTFHLNNGAGSSDWFERPVGEFVKVATVFDERGASVSIKVLPGDINFSEALSDDVVRQWIDANGEASSLFQLAA